ncbi:MAG TPA: ubiquinol-cytochrome c reductase iron-sulfur subunit [Rhodospirillaceae bacterium]|nr:ubiquinol-cytochrome c reductase iron-sulfur subunit [Rhodospirillaceae bacterium]HAA93200.1 ubiquinol-cytochrome c reductase iron-sulfur subunit [Rhodospirillaceae bacterium]HAT34070.1 ubiquinol-cytochrome c reductase iron-sulfur subunit [Rhodospirillaceae bacterium]
MSDQEPERDGRRDFLQLTAGAVGAVGAVSFGWPLVFSMDKSAEVKALSSTELDVSSIQPGQAILVKWRKKPYFVRRRTKDEISAAEKVDVASLRDPESDKERVNKEKPEWLVVGANCTHFGCIPTGAKATENRGEYGGFYCPCHGSHYDTSGRIRKGPAPKNLPVPPYQFVSDKILKIG